MKRLVVKYLEDRYTWSGKKEGIREKYRDPDLVKVKTNLKGLSKIVKREATDGPFGITISLAKN